MEKISRRKFLYMGAATTAAAAVAACQPKTVIVEKTVKETVVVTEEKVVEKEVTKEVVVEREVTREIEVEKLITPTALPSNFGESPVDAQMVAEGKLAPVDERLPLEPLVIYPYDEIGQYGGQVRVASLGTSLLGGDGDMVNPPQQQLRITPNLREQVPNILKDWSMAPDFKSITMFMRRGHKWSDGEPVTADDVLFVQEDVILNEDLTPGIPEHLRPGGTPMVVEKLDDYSYKITFAVPVPYWPMLIMAHKYDYWDQWINAKHYVQQFHIKYNPKADELAKEAERDFWYQNFGDKRSWGLNMDVPHLRAFVAKEDSPERTIWARNPFFFMTDSEGNQLPYIDEIGYSRDADLALHNAKIVGGSYDFVGFDTSIQNYQTYEEAGIQGDYHVVLWRSGKGSDVVYNVNCNYGWVGFQEEQPAPDPTRDMMREIFTDDRFRKALSLAINREEVNEILYFGRGDPRQMTVIPDSRHFKPEYAAAYAQYDPDQANALLDELGLEWNEDGVHRNWPDGTPMIIAWDLYESETPKGPTTELIKEYWMNVGIDIQYKSITRTLITQKIQANEEPMSLWHGDETTDVLALLRPKFFVPIGNYSDESCWGVLWGQYWRSLGTAGVKPPPVIQELYDWTDEFLETGGLEPAANILSSQAEHIWTIGVVGNAPQPLVVNNALTNVAPDGYWVWDSLWTWPVYPEQWFFKS
jgi:peptide/nickel transport system substrate-binding protein